MVEAIDDVCDGVERRKGHEGPLEQRRPNVRCRRMETFGLDKSL